MPESKHIIGTKTTIEAMFEAISIPNGLEQWWATSAKGNPKVGETLELYFENLTTLKFRYEEITPHKKLILTCIEGPESWNGTSLIHEIEKKNNQVYLTHTHTNIREDEPEALGYFNTKWTVYLLSLKSYLENGTGTPFPKETKLFKGD